MTNISFEMSTLTMEDLGPITANAEYLELYNNNGTYLGTPADLLYQWLEENPQYVYGNYTDTKFINHPVYIKSFDKFLNCEFTINNSVDKEMYFNNLTLSQVSGFLNETTGILNSRKFELRWSFDAITTEWQKN